MAWIILVLNVSNDFDGWLNSSREGDTDNRKICTDKFRSSRLIVYISNLAIRPRLPLTTRACFVFPAFAGRRGGAFALIVQSILNKENRGRFGDYVTHTLAEGRLKKIVLVSVLC